MTRTTLAALLLAFIVCAGIAADSLLYAATEPTRRAVVTTVNVPDGRCHEDMACWDCESMSDRVCGPGAQGQ